jgi:hypothetical protein
MGQLKEWKGQEEDGEGRRDLKLWFRRFRKKLDRRLGNWLERAQGPDRKVSEKRRSGQVPTEQRATSHLYNLRRQLKGNPPRPAPSSARSTSRYACASRACCN